MAKGIIDTITKAIHFTEGGFGSITYAIPTPAEIVNGDTVSFDIEGPFAINIQKVAVQQPLVNAEQIYLLEEGWLMCVYKAKINSIFRVVVDEEEFDARKALPEEKFWRHVKNNIPGFTVTEADKTEIERLADEMRPTLDVGEEVRIWISRDHYVSTEVEVKIVYIERANYDANGNIM